MNLEITSQEFKNRERMLNIFLGIKRALSAHMFTGLYQHQVLNDEEMSC